MELLMAWPFIPLTAILKAHVHIKIDYFCQAMWYMPSIVGVLLCCKLNSLVEDCMQLNFLRLFTLCFGLSLLLSACSGESTPVAVTMGGAIQGKSLALAQTVSTIAGPMPGLAGAGASVRFYYPYGIASDGTNIYVSDPEKNIIQKVEIATGVTTILAGDPENGGSTDGTGLEAQFYIPRGITTDGTNLYVVDSGNSTIRKIAINTGVVTTLAGSPGSWGATDGTGSAARFSNINGITTDGTNVYVTDRGSIRRVVIASGLVSTLAGTPYSQTNTSITSTTGTGTTTTSTTTVAADGIGAAAIFFNLQAITTDGTNLYVTDAGMIRKVVISTGEVTSLAGKADTWGSSDGTGSAASFRNPQGVTTDGTNLYVADTNNNTIRKVVIATGDVTTLAGSPDGQFYSHSYSVTTTGKSVSAIPTASSDGIGGQAKFYNPQGIILVGTNLFVADAGNGTIRKVTAATGEVTTIAGSQIVGSTDGTGSDARFYNPSSITTDGTNLFVADTGNSVIRKVVIATGEVTTLAGTAGMSGSTDGTGAAARFGNPHGITTDGSNLFVTDFNTIRKVEIATGVVTTLAGNAGAWVSRDGTGDNVSFGYLQGITTDGTNLYVSDNNTIRKVVIATGVVTTLAGSVGTYGWADGTGAAASFRNLSGLTTDGLNLYVTDYNCIRKVAIATGVVTTVAGSTTQQWGGTIDGTGPAARFSYLRGITTDGTNLYVTDDNAIRKVVIATRAVTTLAGTFWNSGCSDGTGERARFNNPSDLTTNGSNLFVVEPNNGTIRRIF